MGAVTGPALPGSPGKAVADSRFRCCVTGAGRDERGPLAAKLIAQRRGGAAAESRQGTALLTGNMVTAGLQGGGDRSPPERRTGGVQTRFPYLLAAVVMVSDRVLHLRGRGLPCPNRAR
jgi:hypothetical protein